MLEDIINEKFGCRAETIFVFIYKASYLITLARLFFFKNSKKLIKKGGLFNEQSKQCAI